MNFYIGVDLGGTKISVGLFDEAGNLISKTKFPTNKNHGYQKGFEEISNTIKKIIDKTNIDKKDLKSIGMAIPGVVDTKNGKLIKASNLPGWENINVANLMYSLLGIHTYIEHDTNLMVIAEKTYGFSRDKDDFICITIGTGIGLGLFLNGDLYKGANGMAGELSHICVEANGDKCGCGNYGCLETVASGIAMQKIALKEINKGTDTTLKNLKIITGKDIYEAASKGDKLSYKIMHTAGVILGTVILNLAMILDPSVIILSGGLVCTDDLLFNIIKDEVNKRTYLQEERKNLITRSKLGEDAVLIGAMELGKISFLKKTLVN